MADDNIPKKLRAKKKSVCWCWMLVLVKWVDRLIHVSCKRCGRECLAPLDLLKRNSQKTFFYLSIIQRRIDRRQCLLVLSCRMNQDILLLHVKCNGIYLYNNIILFFLFVFGHERDRHALRRGFFLACIRVGRIAILKHSIPDAKETQAKKVHLRRPYTNRTKQRPLFFQKKKLLFLTSRRLRHCLLRKLYVPDTHLL